MIVLTMQVPDERITRPRPDHTHIRYKTMDDVRAGVYTMTAVFGWFDFEIVDEPVVRKFHCTDCGFRS